MEFHNEGLHDLVAIGNAAGREAGARLSDLPAERLRGHILEEQGVHCAFETNMEFVDSSLGKGGDGHLPSRQSLVNGSGVLLVAR